VSTPTGSEPTAPRVLLRFDGVLHASDLPVQSFARHLTQTLPADQVRVLIAGMRGFLEGKPELIPEGIELAGAEDGYQAVEILGRATGLSAETITAAYQASRVDLAASAWAVDASDGLGDMIAAIKGQVHLAVLAEPGDPAPAAVLDSVGIGLQVVDAPIARACSPQSIENVRPTRVLVVGTRWAGELVDARDLGFDTALVDRYRLGRGAPTLRSPDLAGLLEPIIRWCAGSTIETGKRHDEQQV